MSGILIILSPHHQSLTTNPNNTSYAFSERWGKIKEKSLIPIQHSLTYIWQHFLKKSPAWGLGYAFLLDTSSNWPAWFVNFHGLRWAQQKCQPFRSGVCFPCRKVKGPLRNKRSFKSEFGGKYEDKLLWVHFRLQKGLCFPDSSCC